MDEFVESPIGKIPKNRVIDEYSLLHKMGNIKFSDTPTPNANGDGFYWKIDYGSELDYTVSYLISTWY